MRNTSLLAAPAEPVIENDLPLDLSCNSRRRSEADEDETEECRRRDDVVSSGGGGVSIGGPPSPPRSPADFRALSELGYVAYHRQLMAMERQRQWLERKQQEQQEEDEQDRLRRHHHRRTSYHHHRSRGGDDVDDDDDLLDEDDDLLIMRRSGSGSPPGSGHDESDDSDDSSHQPMDLGANPKAYKKSLMKRYRKFQQHFFRNFGGCLSVSGHFGRDPSGPSGKWNPSRSSIVDSSR